MSSAISAASEVSARPLTGAGALARSTPYPWPYDAAFNAGRCALLVFDTASPMPPDADVAWDCVAELANALADAGGMVVEIHSRRPPRPGSSEPHVVIDQRVPGADQVIVSPAWDAFYGTALDQILRANGRDLLLLCGAWLEVGVHSTMRGANDRGYECALVADASISGDTSLLTAALSSIEMSGGIFGVVAHTDDVLSLISLRTNHDY